jgi:hypothetical protein
MGNQILGYGLSGIGLLVLASGFDVAKNSLAKFVPFLSTVSSFYLQIIGGVLIVFGAFFLLGKKGAKQTAEVPIYHGKNVVGYRRQ